MALYPDADAEYVGSYHYEASTLEPYVARPHSPDNVVPISQVAGTRVQQAFLGTCTNGHHADMAAAARILKGRRVAKGVRLIVVPATSEAAGIYRAAEQIAMVRALRPEAVSIGLREIAVPDIPEAELAAFLEPKVSRYKLPKRFLIWETLPKSAYGKITKKMTS